MKMSRSISIGLRYQEKPLLWIEKELVGLSK